MMNIDQAKAIPITKILEILNRKPVKDNGSKVLYTSILRNEKTASLWVDSQHNTWRDFGDTKWEGGDGVHLVRAYLDSENENSEVIDALRWLRNMTGYIPTIKPVMDFDEKPCDNTLVLRNAEVITKRYLLDYGESRGIPQCILKKNFKQVTLFNNKSQKTFYTLGMQNDRKGYELRNAFFKGCVGRKYITFIRGTIPKPDGINIFEGAFDFASAITLREGRSFEEDSIVLHSVSNLKFSSAYLRNYGYRYANTWMDNDNPGNEATHSFELFCKAEPNLTHIPKNEEYRPYKDVNAALMAKLKL